MPRSAIRTGLVDIQLSPEDIAAEIAHISSKYSKHSLLLPKIEQPLNDDQMKNIYAVLKQISNVNFTHYKQTTIIRRIERRMMLSHKDTLDAYVEYLYDSPTEALALSKEVLIGVTNFFRDPEFFEILKEKTIKEIVQKSSEDEAIRVWVAGCSTSEEAYSIAILFSEVLEHMGIKRDIKIFATDLDKESINIASKGVYIKGLQDKGIGTSIKHFACNSQETKRLISNSCLDERTLHEIYLKAFEIAIKEAKPWTVMSSYNMINGVYSSENPYLLKNILRKDWGFEGAVISDWGALNKESDSFKNGLNLEMPGLDNSRFKRLYKDLKKGNMTLEELDEACIPMIDLERKVKQGRQIKLDCDYSNNEQIAREVANNCAVLLKNEQNILPINKNQNVLFIGGFIFNPRYQGGGSSNITPYSLKLINDLIKIEFPNSEIEEGFSVEKDLDKNFDEEQINQIINKAKKAEKIVFLGGLPLSFESEGYDRKSMKIPENQIFMFNKLYEVNPNIVLVLQGGSPMEIPFIEKPKGILLQYLSGESVASSFIDLLTGVSNPSGRLAETWPIKESDNPLYGRYPENELNVLYTEGQYIGYRYYINKMINPLYPFGYGLSYTRFSYNDIKLNNNKLSFKVKNIGSTFGKEVIQIYVTSKDNEKKYSSLKDFTKISLNPNEEKEVVIEIKDDFFTYYDVSQKRFVKGSGQFEVSINKNACEVIQSFILDIDG